MSQKYYYFYSEQSEKSMKYLDVVDESNAGESLCVDSSAVRKKLKKIGITQVPSIIFAEDKQILQNQDAIDFLKQFIQKPTIRPRVQHAAQPPPRTPISAIGKTTILRTSDEVSESIKKAVKENSIMDKVKMLTKEREDVIVDNK
jgi:hypothetical protein